MVTTRTSTPPQTCRWEILQMTSWTMPWPRDERNIDAAAAGGGGRFDDGGGAPPSIRSSERPSAERLLVSGRGGPGWVEPGAWQGCPTAAAASLDLGRRATNEPRGEPSSLTTERSNRMERMMTVERGMPNTAVTPRHVQRAPIAPAVSTSRAGTLRLAPAPPRTLTTTPVND